MSQVEIEFYGGPIDGEKQMITKPFLAATSYPSVILHCPPDKLKYVYKLIDGSNRYELAHVYGPDYS